MVEDKSNSQDESDDPHAGTERTGLSDNVTTTKLTPDKPETSSMEGRRLCDQTTDWDRAAVHRDIIKRSKSMPDLQINLNENVWFSKHPKYHRVNSCSGSLNNTSNEDRSISECVSKWSNNTVFGQEDTGVEWMMKHLKINEKDVEILQQRATPRIQTVKRQLKLSPDTPMGTPSKILITGDNSPQLRKNDIIVELGGESNISPPAHCPPAYRSPKNNNVRRKLVGFRRKRDNHHQKKKAGNSQKNKKKKKGSPDKCQPRIDQILLKENSGQKQKGLGGGGSLCNGL